MPFCTALGILEQIVSVGAEERLQKGCIEPRKQASLHYLSDCQLNKTNTTMLWSVETELTSNPTQSCPVASGISIRFVTWSRRKSLTKQQRFHLPFQFFPCSSFDDISLLKATVQPLVISIWNYQVMHIFFWTRLPQRERERERERERVTGHV
jgi:hypothetical protein